MGGGTEEGIALPSQAAARRGYCSSWRGSCRPTAVRRVLGPPYPLPTPPTAPSPLHPLSTHGRSAHRRSAPHPAAGSPRARQAGRRASTGRARGSSGRGPRSRPPRATSTASTTAAANLNGSESHSVRRARNCSGRAVSCRSGPARRRLEPLLSRNSRVRWCRRTRLRVGIGNPMPRAGPGQTKAGPGRRI